jgi:hypothetical protein
MGPPQLSCAAAGRWLRIKDRSCQHRQKPTLNPQIGLTARPARLRDRNQAVGFTNHSYFSSAINPKPVRHDSAECETILALQEAGPNALFWSYGRLSLRRFIAALALHPAPNAPRALGRIKHPLPHHPGRIVAHVHGMTAVQLSTPVPFFVLIETDHCPQHSSTPLLPLVMTPTLI